uniref:Membrane fusion protein (MFP) family protein n=1 Tax=Rhodopseudomonas palustris (strain BisA53) TaxID=316055 RepID=Q07SP5_RHOP5
MASMLARSRSALLKLVEFKPNRLDEREFLPAALEVTETPPNPLGRMTALVLCAVGFAGIGWAILGQVDIVAVASGKIIPVLRTQVVQPFETASVKAVLVRPGQRVRAGDPLIELDKTSALAEQDRAKKDLVAARLDDTRLTALLEGKSSALFESVEDATALDLGRARSQLAAQVAMRASQLANLAQEQAQRLAERDALRQTLVKVERSLPMVAERAEIRTKASELGNASIIARLESQQLLIEARAEVDITRTKIGALDAGILGLSEKITATDAEIRTSALTELARARERASAAEEALAKATRRAELQTLRAPIDGSVQQLHIATVGAVVTPAQQLLSIVPNDNRVEVEAVLENRDMGFVGIGQRVEVKVDAFPFTRYGLLDGKVIAIDRDAEVAPVNQSGTHGAQRAADETDNVQGSERLRYMVRIALEPGNFLIQDRAAVLLPGMSVKAEIITGKRRIIDFVMAPLREHMHDAMRER